MSALGHPLRTDANYNAAKARKFGEFRFFSHPVRASLVPGYCPCLGFALKAARYTARDGSPASGAEKDTRNDQS